MDQASGDRARLRRLFFGVVLCWLAPNAVFVAFMATAELRAPFDSIAAMHPAFTALSVFVAFAIAALVTAQFKGLRDAARAGVPAEALRARMRQRFLLLPVIALAYVGLGTLLHLTILGDAALWSRSDLLVAAVTTFAVAVHILVPLGILCLDEFGVAFGDLVKDEPILPSFLRALPVLGISLMIGLLMPLSEYVRFGQVSLATFVLFALIVPYALAVTLLSLRYTNVALRSVLGVLASAQSDPGVVIERLRPQTLDDYGVLIARTRDLVAGLESARRSLAESEGRVRDFAEAASDWFYETDGDLLFTYVSDRIEATIGMSADEIVGRSFADVAARWPSGDWAPIIRAVAAGEAFRSVEVSPAPQMGEAPLHLEVSGTPRRGADGTFLGYRGTGKDVSAVVEARGRLRERETQLAHAQKMEAVGQLTGGIAHDFNNLLTAVAGSLELLRVRNPDLADTRLLTDALSASRRAGDLVQRLLAFSRRQALRPEVVDVGEKLGEMSELLRISLGVGVELEVHLPTWPVRALVDPAQLESAVLNLAINARDAMPAGGRLGLTVSRIHLNDALRELLPGEYVSVVVEDSGTGIPPDVLPHVFEPFFSTKPDGAGSGLGLSMVFGFVRQSGGELRLESAPGKGTRIELLLPSAKGTTEHAPVTGTHRAIAVKTEARVLVVDDEPSVLAVVTEALELVGCEVVHASTAESALAVVDGGEPIDLVLSDVVLPGSRSGVDIVRRARALHPEMPCVLMSGFARDYLDDGVADLAEVPVLTKPFRLEELLRIVTGVLGPR